MDYVLFGMGYGATLMLLGWALRTFGPGRKYRDVNHEDIENTIAQRRWVRFIQGLGGVIAIAGTALVLFTFIIMLVNPDDETGGFISIVIWGFLGAAVLIWCWFYVSRFGLTGIWSKDEGYGFRRGSTPRRSSLSAEGVSSTRVVRSSGENSHDATNTSTTHQHEPAASPNADEQARVDAPNPPGGPSPAQASGSIAGEQPENDMEPQYDFGDSSNTTVSGESGGRAEAIRRLRERQVRSGDPSG